jgi:hypothetical protein
MCNWKFWGALALLLTVIGYGQEVVQVQSQLQPSLDVYAFVLEKKMYIFVTLLSKEQVLTTPFITEYVQVEFQDTFGKTFATEKFTEVTLSGTTKLIMDIPTSAPSLPWTVVVTAVAGNETYSEEATVFEEPSIVHPSEIRTVPKGWAQIAPMFAQCATGNNWCSFGKPGNCNVATGEAWNLSENGQRWCTGASWFWFSSYYYAGCAFQLRVKLNLSGEIERPSTSWTKASLVLYALIKGYDNQGHCVDVQPLIVWANYLDGIFNIENYSQIFSFSLPPNTTYVKVDFQIIAKVKDASWHGGPNAWVRINYLQLKEVWLNF